MVVRYPYASPPKMMSLKIDVPVLDLQLRSCFALYTSSSSLGSCCGIVKYGKIHVARENANRKHGKNSWPVEFCTSEPSKDFFKGLPWSHFSASNFIRGLNSKIRDLTFKVGRFGLHPTRPI